METFNNKGRKNAKVYRSLMFKYFSGELKTGDYINETKVSRDLGVSRTAVRDALNQLITENLV